MSRQSRGGQKNIEEAYSPVKALALAWSVHVFKSYSVSEDKLHGHTQLQKRLGIGDHLLFWSPLAFRASLSQKRHSTPTSRQTIQSQTPRSQGDTMSELTGACVIPHVLVTKSHVSCCP